MYLTYQRYQELGGSLPEQQFNLYERLSEAEINAIIIGGNADEELLETCAMILVDGYAKYDNDGLNGRALTMSNDGVSVKYAEGVLVGKELDIARTRVRLLLSNAKLNIGSLAVKHRV